SVRMRIVMNETIVRMSAYPHQIARALGDLFKPFTIWLRANLGFDADDALKIIRGLEVRSERVYNQKLERARIRLDALAATIAGGSVDGFPPEIVEQLRTMDPPARQPALQHLGETFLAQEISSALAFDAGEIAEYSSIDEATVQRFFDIFSMNLGDVPKDYLLPSPSLPLKTHPLLRLRDKYVLPSAMLLDTAIQPVLERLMNPDVGDAHAAADKQLWERYSTHRKEYAEARSVELLQTALRGAVAYRDLIYRFNGREYELDGLILFDRYLIVEE